MSENCKYEAREREEGRMAPRLLVQITVEMVVSPRQNGRKKGRFFCNDRR